MQHIIMSPEPPQPYVVDVDELGNEILSSQRSAARVTKPSQRKRRMVRGFKVVHNHDSKGLLEAVVRGHTGLDVMTILSGNHCREENQAAGGLKFRRLFCPGTLQYILVLYIINNWSC